MTEKSAARKAAESAIEHEDIVDNAVKLGKNKGLQVEATPGNDPRGDIKVARKDSKEFLDLLGNTIDKKQQRRGA